MLIICIQLIYNVISQFNYGHLMIINVPFCASILLSGPIVSIAYLKKSIIFHAHVYLFLYKCSKCQTQGQLVTCSMLVKNLCENSKMQRHATILQEHLKHSVQNHDWHVRLDTYVLTSEWMLDGWDGFLSGSQTKKMNKSSWTPKAQLSLSVCLSVWLCLSLCLPPLYLSDSPLF